MGLKRPAKRKANVSGWAALAIVGFGILLTCSAASADWPQWRGPNRDGKSTEAGLMKIWPEGGPTLLWKSPDLGYGYSTVSVSDGVIYTSGIIGEDLAVTALNMDGTVKWQKAVTRGWADRRRRPGARVTPTVDEDRLYVLSGHAVLVALDARSGEKLWTVDLVQELGARVPQWGAAESPLVDGDVLICTPGGATGMVGLKKTTGEVLWTGEPLDTSMPYASPIAVEFAGARQYIHLVQSGMVGVEGGSGRLLWRYRRAAPPNRPACSTPLHEEGRAFAASGYNVGGGQVKLTVVDGEVTAPEVWDTKDMVNQHGGMVLVDGHIYGNHEGGWSCLDFHTGEQRWYARGIGKGSVAYADGMLYCFAEKDGAVGLVKADPAAFEMTGSFVLPSEAEGPRWAHPVVCGGRLYLRHAGTLYAYDLKPGR